MKISKTAVLALWWVFMTAGLWLMFVSATEKYLELDLNNAVQHFERVRFISSWSNNSVVDMMRVWEEDGPLINIVANNFAITQTWSTWKNIIIDWGSYSSILWWMANSLKWNYSVILWWEKNTISNGDYYDVILWWVGNSVNGAASVILWWTGNKISNGLSSIVWWSDNEITASNSVAVWKNIRILRSSSNWNNVVMWSNMTITGDNIFLWSDSAL